MNDIYFNVGTGTFTVPDKWDIFFLGLARYIATASKDPSLKCGAVVVRGNRQIGQGFNGFPPSVSDYKIWYEDRVIKHRLVVHAEVNAILDAMQKGSVDGCTMYNWPVPPCGSCAIFIAAAGIKKVVAPKGNNPRYPITDPEFVFDRAGIEYDWWSDLLIQEVL